MPHDFPTIIPPETRHELDLEMHRLGRELIPLIKLWQHISPGEEHVLRLQSDIVKWCTQHLCMACELSMKWIRENNPATDAEDRGITEREIRTCGEWYVAAALQLFDTEKRLVRGAPEEVEQARQWIRDQADAVIQQWLRRFRDWAREQKNNSTTATLSAGDRSPTRAGTSVVPLEHEAAGTRRTDEGRPVEHSLSTSTAVGGGSVQGRDRKDETRLIQMNENGARPKQERRKHRKPKKPAPPKHDPPKLEVDENTRLARWGSDVIKINSRADFMVLNALHGAGGEIVSYVDLLSGIKPGIVSEEVREILAPPEVKQAVAHVRRAFKQVGCPHEIKNVQKRGYRLDSRHE